MGNPIILYDNRFEDGTLTPCSTKSGYDPLNIKDLRPYTFWKADNTTTPCYFKVNCGSAKKADCLGIIGHNFKTIGASISFGCSSDDFIGDTTICLSPFNPFNDKAILKTFNEQNKNDWRLKIDGVVSAEPYSGVLMAGEKLELPYPPDTPYNLIDEGVETESHRSRKKGVLLGSSVFYHPIEIKCRVSLLQRTWVMDTFKPFWDNHGSKMKPFFFAPDIGNFPDIIYWAKFKDSARFRVPLRISPYVEYLDLEMEAVREE